jgi:hypothetical protein
VVKGVQCNDLALVAQSDGKVVVAFKDITVGGKHVTRFLANGSPDTTFGTGGTVAVPDPLPGFSLTSGTYTLFAQAEDSYGVFSDPFALTLTVQ